MVYIYFGLTIQLSYSNLTNKDYLSNLKVIFLNRKNAPIYRTFTIYRTEKASLRFALNFHRNKSAIFLVSGIGRVAASYYVARWLSCFRDAKK